MEGHGLMGPNCQNLDLTIAFNLFKTARLWFSEATRLEVPVHHFTYIQLMNMILPCQKEVGCRGMISHSQAGVLHVDMLGNNSKLWKNCLYEVRKSFKGKCLPSIVQIY